MYKVPKWIWPDFISRVQGDWIPLLHGFDWMRNTSLMSSESPPFYKGERLIRSLPEKREKNICSPDKFS